MPLTRYINLKTIGAAIGIAVSVLIIIQVSVSLSSLSETSRQAAAQSAQAAVEKAAVLCYAIEGAYPMELSYLTDNYGLQLQEDKYLYFYQALGGNLTPVIEVIPR